MKELFLIVVLSVPACAARQAEVKSQGVGGGGAAAAQGARPDASQVNAAQLLEDVRVLSSDEMEGRGAGTEGGARARAYVVRRFGEVGLKPASESFEQPLELPKGSDGKRRKGANVVGLIRGRSRPESFIVVTAHYDHLGIKDDKVYNGADDNASGVAVLLQLAAYFQREQPSHSILFAALDAEERGMVGARSLVKRLLSEKRSVALNINLDMVSRSDSGELYAAGTHHYPQLKPPLERVAAVAPVKLLLGHDRPELGSDDWTRQSDHFAFHSQKIPFVYFGVEDHKDYHRPTDDFEAIKKEFFLKSAETILEAVKVFDNSTPAR